MAKPKYADIALNLGDPQYTGTYHGRTKHASDRDAVISRAKGNGVERMLLTGTSLQESREVLDLARQYGLHSTAGCHPTSTTEIDSYASGSQGYFHDLEALIEEDWKNEGGSKRITSIGEVGLDYDRLHFAPKDVQLKHLPQLLRLSQKFKLPLFLHSRTSEAHVDLVKVLKEVGWGSDWPGGVVHSFTGTKEEVDELVGLGLYIGINGCSLKTAENLEVVKHVPLNRLLLETDGPWCSITTSHASHAHLPPKDSPLHLQKVNKPEKWAEGQGVKGRMEPCEVPLIAQVVASVKGLSLEQVAKAAWDNSTALFWRDE